MADDDPGPRRPGPAQKYSWSTILRKGSNNQNDVGAGGNAAEAAETPKALGPINPQSGRPTSLGRGSFRGGVTRTSSNVGLGLAAAAGNPGNGLVSTVPHPPPSGPLAARSHSVVHAGLLAPGQGNGTTADVVTAVKDLQLRKRSIFFQQAASQAGPSLGARTGSLSTYFFAPNPTPGKGVCFSPDGTFVMRWGYGTDVKLLSADDGTLMQTMVTPTSGAVRYATFSNDGSKVAVATEDCKVYVWVLANRHLLCTLDVGAEPLAHVVFSHDSKHLLSCDDEGQLELWSIGQATGHMVRRYETGHISKRCGFSSDGESVLSCAGDDCGLMLLSTRTGIVQLTQQFEEISESRNRATYVISPDGTKVLLFILEQVYGINLVLYDTSTDTHIALQVCDGAVTHADFSNDSSFFITAGRDDLIHVWESDTGMLRTTLVGHASDVMFCKISEEGDVAVSGDSEGTVLVWSLSDGACVMRLQAHSSPIAYVDINADGTRAVTVDTEGHALLWFLDAARVFEVMRQHSDLVSCVVPTPDGNSLIVGYKDGALRSWNLCDGPGFAATVTWTHSKQACPVEQLAMRPDGAHVASAGRDGAVVITDVARGQVVSILCGHNDFVTGLLYSDRSDVLVTASRVGEVSVWSAKPYGTEPLKTMEVPERLEVASLAISPNQAFLAAATAGGSVHVWSLSTFVMQADLKVTDLPATRLTFNLDASVLAVGSADGSVTLVDPLTGTRAASYKGNASGITDVSFMMRPQEHILLSLCGRQAILWNCSQSSQAHTTDFIADSTRIFASESIGVLPNRTCVAHDAVVLYDPINHAAMYDMLPRPPEQHPGNSYLFRQGTTLTSLYRHGSSLSPIGSGGYPMVLFCAPDTTVHMLGDETSGTRCLDFSSDGRLLVSGTLRGELIVWDVVHQQQMHKWVAHKRYTITCVRFTHDATAVYSCGEDCKVIMWDWRRQAKLATLIGHQAPVAAVEMSVDGNQMASGDRDGFIFIWDTVTHTPKQVIPAHDGAVMCCSLSPCGTMVASTGADEHIVILDVQTGSQLATLDDAMDGKGMTIKFSFDGTRLLVGGEKGAVLIWDVARNCLLYDIPAHDGKVFDCGWSGDSRRLLSVGSDGKARLWDAAAGSELCQANFERVMGAVESGGFVHCDLSATGNRMAGCTAKGQLIDWDVGAELRCVPEGSMLYQRLSALSLGRSREVYARLLRQYPLLPNTQDSRGWTILMHAVANSNPEITKLIIGSVPAASAKLGLTASAVQNTILSSIRHVPRIHMMSSMSAPKGSGVWNEPGSKRVSMTAAEGAANANSVTKLNVNASATSVKKSPLGRPKDPAGDDDDGDDDDDDDSDEHDRVPRVVPASTAGSRAASAAASRAVTPASERQVTSPTGAGAFILGRVGTFLRNGAEMLAPGRDRRSSASGDGIGGAVLTSGPSAPKAPEAAAGGGDSGSQLRSPPRAAGSSGLLFSAFAGPGQITSGPAGPIAEATTAPTTGLGSTAGATASSPLIPSRFSPNSSPATRGSILKSGPNRTGGSITSSPSSSSATAAADSSGFAGSPRSAGGAAANGGGSAHGGVAYGGITVAGNKRSLLGSVLEAERDRDMSARSRRRSFMFGNVTHALVAANVSSSGPGGSGNISTSPLGRSIRHAVHMFARVGSRGNQPAASRDLEEGVTLDDGLERHVSDLSRNGQEEDHVDPGKGPHMATPGGPKDNGNLGSPSGAGSRGSGKVWPEPQTPDRAEPNAVKIALDAGAADCVQHVLDAVLAQKVTPGSYHAITAAIPAVAQQYPTMCQVFLSGLPLRPLGEMEVPSSVAARGMIVTSAPSYTSYKEMWMNELQLQGATKGPMALMEACMVRLPFAANSGKTSVLHTLVESSVPVQTFGSDTVKAIVDYKWRNFAQRRIYIKALVYLLYTILFTVFAVLFADHDSTAGIRQLYDTHRGVAIVIFSVVLFIYGIYFLVLECVQLAALGAAAYFDSFWNIVDIAAYVTTLIVCPCTVLRYGLGEGQFVAVMVAAEVIMLWIKVLFFGLAIDGVGTFIFMTAEIIKGLKYFIGLLATLYISFAVAFMVLFRNSPSTNDDGSTGMGGLYGSFGNALLNVYLIMFQIGDPHDSADSEYGHFAILLFCTYMFALLVVLLNMLITLMADIYQKVKGVQHFVFLKGRAELIIDVESTTGVGLTNAENHPYLHLLMPLRKDAAGSGDSDGDMTNGGSSESQRVTAGIPRLGAGAANGVNVSSPTGGAGGSVSRAVSLTGGLSPGRGGLADVNSGSASDDDDGRSVAGGRGGMLSRMASFKSMRSMGLGANTGGPMGGGTGMRRPTEAYNAFGGMTMMRRAGATATGAAGGGGGGGGGSGGIDADRLERLERVVNRLASNVDAIMAHMRVRRTSNSGGAALMAADVAAMGAPLGRRTGFGGVGGGGGGGGLRYTATGIGSVSMHVRAGAAGGGFGGVRGGSGEPAGFGMPAGMTSRGPSRPTSATVASAPPSPPTAVMLGIVAASGLPATAATSSSLTAHSSGSASHGHSHAHLHATFADDHKTTSVRQASCDFEGAGGQRGQANGGSAGGSSGSAGSSAGGAPSLVATVGVRACSPISPAMTSGGHTTSSSSDAENITIGGGTGIAAGHSPTGSGGGSGGGGGMISAAAIGMQRRGFGSDIVMTPTILEGDERTEVEPVAVTSVAAARTTSPASRSVDVPSLGSGGTSALLPRNLEVLGSSGAVRSRASNSGSVRHSAGGEPQSCRSFASAGSGVSTGGVAAAARLVLDPEEPPVWGGSGPGRPAGSSSGTEAPRIRTPGEVEPGN
ncbi:hypothetical protein Agub_g11948 [Astrephomene gubernaculifera]|uniref:Ion transport domain-containing protein n=1 Tax=Astrephomene gubernaculifera TaxID=47775 RepID=A0AAD3HQX4_9CHLO|nr:hypothetical protein Agub_g11948 [Astrephomene gubernaculifera]